MNIFDRLKTCGYKLTTEKSNIYYVTEDYQQAIYDIEDEGSGELKIYFQNAHICQRVMSLLKEFGKYYKQEDDLVLNIIIDESDISPTSSCESGCMCINCSAELQEKNETVCNLYCKCINCDIEKK